MRIFFPEFWSYDIQISKKQEHDNGKEIAAKLILHLKQVCDLKKYKLCCGTPSTPTIFKGTNKNLEFVLNQLKDKMKIINLFNELENIRNEDPELFSSYFLKDNYHYSSLGNDFVANSIYKNIKDTF